MEQPCMPPVNYIQSFHTLYIREIMLEISKINLWKKISPKVPIRMKTLERLCSKKFTYKKTYTITGNLIYLWLS